MTISTINSKKLLPVFAILVMCTGSLTISSCKDDNSQPPKVMVPGVTSIRLVHSSAISSSVPLDLYVDDVKVNAASVAFPGSSEYFATTSGSKKITVKHTNGNVIKDTVLTINDGNQYSVFVKEWQHLDISTATPPVTSLSTKAKYVITNDNNTTVPEEGMAKVRFVNCATTGSNIASSGAVKPASFLRVYPSGMPDPQYITFNLVDIGSDFTYVKAGEITFRATVPRYLGAQGDIATVTMTPVVLEPGKLYTVYLVGSPGGTSETNSTAVASTLDLKIIATN